MPPSCVEEPLGQRHRQDRVSSSSMSRSMAGSSQDMPLDHLGKGDTCNQDGPATMEEAVGMCNNLDDTSGEWLDPKLVHMGCMEEMQRSKAMEVRLPMPREQALQHPRTQSRATSSLGDHHCLLCDS